MKRLVSLVLVLIVMSCSFSINAQLDTGLYECGHGHEITDGNCGNSIEASFKCEDCLLAENDLEDLPPITTLDGTNVVYEKPKYTEWTMSQNVRILRDLYSQHEEIDADDLVAIDCATNRYNGHAYAWYEQDSSIHCWIPNPTAYLIDAHTKSVAWSNLRVGDRIVYYVNGKPVHSAIVISVSGGIRVASKWDDLHLFEHSYDNVMSNFVDPNGLDCKAYRYPSEHTFGAWTNYTSRLHRRQCTYCDATEFGGHVLSDWTDNGSTTHERTCSICDLTITGNHSFTGWTDHNSTVHQRTCSVCGRVEQRNHSFSSWSPSGTSFHSRTCGTCKRTESEEHTYPSSWSDNGAQNHIKRCSRCSKTLTASHTFSRWQSSGPNGHRRQCTACGRSELQAHTFNGITCTVCGYDGPGVAPIICFGFEAFFTPKRKFTATNYIES